MRTSYGDRPHGVLWAQWANEAMKRWKAWDEEFDRTTQERVFHTTGRSHLPQRLGALHEGHAEELGHRRHQVRGADA